MWREIPKIQERKKEGKEPEEMRGDGAQGTDGGFGFRKEHRKFTQEGRQITWEQMQVGSQGGGGGANGFNFLVEIEFTLISQE